MLRPPLARQQNLDNAEPVTYIDRSDVRTALSVTIVSRNLTITVLGLEIVWAGEITVVLSSS